jgi:lycopene cyclase domain-containing protein
MYTYLVLDVAVIFFPLLFSFEKKIRFYRKWKFALPAIGITAIYFTAWDFFFTAKGIWSFNPKYTLEIYFLNLPLEELLFFIAIPYACLFIYAILRDYLMKTVSIPFFNRVVVAFMLLLFFAGLVTIDCTYTSITFLSATLLLGLLVFISRVDYLPVFFTMYIVHLVPFFIINGTLTALPVVIYNGEYNLGIRVGTIPVEDFIYSMLLLLMNVAIYEAAQRRQKAISINE